MQSKACMASRKQKKQGDLFTRLLPQRGRSFSGLAANVKANGTSRKNTYLIQNYAALDIDYMHESRGRRLILQSILKQGGIWKVFRKKFPNHHIHWTWPTIQV